MVDRAGTIGLMADPGVPMRVAERIAGAVALELSEEAESAWDVEISQQRLPLNTEGEIPVFHYSEKLRDSHSWDYLVYLTDLPRLGTDQMLLCQASADARTVLLSVPAVGALRTTRRVQKLVTALVSSAQTNTFDYPSEKLMKDIIGARRVHRYVEPERNDIVSVHLSGWLSVLDLLTGMIRSNQPSKLLPALTNSIALGAATGAFGIFYGSIWELSDSSSPWRLLLISASVIAVLVTWLIGRNGLWAQGREAATRLQPRLDNTATIATVGFGVTMMHLVLWCILFVLGLIVVDMSYLQEQLGHRVSMIEYIHLSWLSASLGTLAGALGSNFNTEDAIREATYSRRVYERRKLADSFEDPDDADE
ncbi:hypothetical protein [Brevibacterium yomogidense]|uniref:hypothetical protein n=1 Tax=Brevibacterium yomogidense TaxID=946573 RepID=UPI0018DF49DE|nr:hypothetical protein [Brevibacterium yomogidense]